MINIIHLGDITKIDGHNVPLVDVVTGGSPCQDLSVAGLRKGLAGERSGLFMEQIRVVKEMRDESKSQLSEGKVDHIMPRYMVWENVCLTADALITCEDGEKRIADVQVGDKVRTHTGRYMPVVKTYVHEDKEVVKITHMGSGEPLICTPNHPIYCCKVNDDGSYGELEFIPAANLTTLHRIAVYNKNLPHIEMGYTAIISVEPLDQKETVYNLSVLEDNTYVANGIICHNCGAFSSNDGEDFRAVLEETARVAEPDAVIPRPPKTEQGDWPLSGCIVGDKWSLAWRVHDAQFWGVPQRRRRVCVLADFDGDTAGKLLFELRGETAGAQTNEVVTDTGTEPRSEIQPQS